jgi:hypothetical protein
MTYTYQLVHQPFGKDVGNMILDYTYTSEIPIFPTSKKSRDEMTKKGMTYVPHVRCIRRLIISLGLFNYGG